MECDQPCDLLALFKSTSQMVVLKLPSDGLLSVLTWPGAIYLDFSLEKISKETRYQAKV